MSRQFKSSWVILAPRLFFCFCHFSFTFSLFFTSNLVSFLFQRQVEEISFYYLTSVHNKSVWVECVIISHLHLRSGNQQYDVPALVTWECSHGFLPVLYILAINLKTTNTIKTILGETQTSKNFNTGTNTQVNFHCSNANALKKNKMPHWNTLDSSALFLGKLSTLSVINLDPAAIMNETPAVGWRRCCVHQASSSIHTSSRTINWPLTGGVHLFAGRVMALSLVDNSARVPVCLTNLRTRFPLFKSATQHVLLRQLDQ